jgi:hypothetical protein
VPLSEHEQKLLDQMEQALLAEDPRFAHQMKNTPVIRGPQRRRLLLGALAVVLGLALVLVGVNTTMWVGAAGFALMVAGAAYALTPVRAPHLVAVPDGTQPAADQPKRKGRSGSGSSFMARLDERWERRRNDGERW